MFQTLLLFWHSAAPETPQHNAETTPQNKNGLYRNTRSQQECEATFRRNVCAVAVAKKQEHCNTRRQISSAFVFGQEWPRKQIRFIDAKPTFLVGETQSRARPRYFLHRTRC